MVGLGTEITFVIYKQRQMQSVADSAAHGAATALSKGNPDHELEAKAIAATGGFVDGAGGVVVKVNMPPTSGNHTAPGAGAIEVIVTQPQTLQLVSLFTAAAFNVGARAVAVGASGKICMWARNGIFLNNGANVEADRCGVAVNGTGPAAALEVSGGAKLTTQSVTVSGDIKVSHSGQLTTTPTTDDIKIGQPATADPYEDVAMPPPPPGPCGEYKGGNPVPGTYCTMEIKKDAKMQPGVYFIRSGQFSVTGGATLTGTDVTIVLTDYNNNKDYATVNITNEVTLSASSDGSHGTVPGVVFFGDRAAPTSTVHNFKGKTALTGALYFPQQTVVYNNGSINAATCTQLIAWQVNFEGGSKFNSDCDSAGTSPIGGGTATLVE
jgi:hypothetical protein